MVDQNQTEQKSYRDQLLAIPGVGPKLVDKIVATFADASALTTAKAQELTAVKGVSTRLAKSVKNAFPTPKLKPTVSVDISNQKSTEETAPKIEQPDQIKQDLKSKAEKKNLRSKSKSLDFSHEEKEQETTETVPGLDSKETEPKAEPAEETISVFPIDAEAQSEEPKKTEQETDIQPPEDDKQTEQVIPITANEPKEGAPPSPTEIVARFHKQKHRKDPFATFHKAQVHLTYADERKAAQLNRHDKLLGLSLIIIGALCFVSAAILWYEDKSSTSITSSSGGSETTDNAFLKLLTFSNSSSLPISSVATGTQKILSQTEDALVQNINNPFGTSSSVDTPEDTIPVTTPDTSPDTTTTPETQTPLVTSEISVVVLNGSGVSGAARNASNLLRQANFSIGTAGNADRFNYDTTTIFYAPEKSREAQAVQLAIKDSYQTILEPTAYEGQTADVVVVIGTN